MMALDFTSFHRFVVIMAGHRSPSDSLEAGGSFLLTAREWADWSRLVGRSWNQSIHGKGRIREYQRGQSPSDCVKETAGSQLIVPAAVIDTAAQNATEHGGYQWHGEIQRDLSMCESSHMVLEKSVLPSSKMGSTS
jgi:hypothetical protein